MATHSSTLAWRIPWIEKPVRLQSIGSQESDMTEQLSTNPWMDSQCFIQHPEPSGGIIIN